MNEGRPPSLPKRLYNRIRNSVRLRRLVQRTYRTLRPILPTRHHIVVCGFPRSGTSLLYNMLGSSLVGFKHEPFEVRSVEHVHRSENFVSKRPSDVLELDQLVERNVWGKKLTAIIPIRDPRDILTSRHPRIPDDYWIDYDHSYRTNIPGPPEKTREGFGEFHAAIERAKRLPGLEVVQVVFERLVADPDAVQQELKNRLHLRFRRPFSRFHEAGSELPYRYVEHWEPAAPELVREDGPVDPSRAQRWRQEEHTERLRQEFLAHPELFDLLIAYGYETDRSWFEPYAGAPESA